MNFAQESKEEIHSPFPLFAPVKIYPLRLAEACTPTRMADGGGIGWVPVLRPPRSLYCNGRVSLIFTRKFSNREWTRIDANTGLYSRLFVSIRGCLWLRLRRAVAFCLSLSLRALEVFRL
jgi:hypothetical protein